MEIENWKTWFLCKGDAFHDEKKDHGFIMMLISSIILIMRRFSILEHCKYLFYIPFGNDEKKRVPPTFVDLFLILEMFVTSLILYFSKRGDNAFIEIIILLWIGQKIQANFYNLFWRYEIRGWSEAEHGFTAHNHLRNIILSYFSFAQVILLFSILYWTGVSSGFENILNQWDAIYYSTITATTLGYGDITARTSTARILSALEVFLCVSFLGTVVARTVTLVQTIKQK